MTTQPVTRLARDLRAFWIKDITAAVERGNSRILAAAQSTAYPVDPSQLGGRVLLASGEVPLVGPLDVADGTGSLRFGQGQVILDQYGMTINVTDLATAEYFGWYSGTDAVKRGRVRFYRGATEAEDGLITTYYSRTNVEQTRLTLGPAGATVTAPLIFTPATSKIVGGSTSHALRNAADSADNLLVTNAGVMTVRSNAMVLGGLNVGTPTTAPIGEIYCSGKSVRLQIGGAGGRMQADRVVMSSTAYTQVMVSARGLIYIKYGTNDSVVVAIALAAGVPTITILGTAGPFIVTANTTVAPGATQIGLTMSGNDLHARTGTTLGSGGNLDIVLLSI